MRPAVSFVASNKDATELLMMFNDFNCTSFIHGFLENKMCLVYCIQIHHIH